jgi:hypothetical protein
MKWPGVAVCVAMLLLLGASSASAETVVLGSKQDTSSYPSAFLAPEDLERAESFQVSVTADPIQSFEYQDYISCRRGSESVSYQSPEQTITPPFSRTILPTLTEPDSCWISVSAEAPFEEAVPGTVRIEVTGNRRPAPPPVSPSPPPPTAQPTPAPVPFWVTCSPPGFFKSGQTKAHQVSCGRGRVIAAKAWRKPTAAGHLVRAYGYRCRRSVRGRSAKIQCSKGAVIVKITGRLRRAAPGPSRDAG